MDLSELDKLRAYATQIKDITGIAVIIGKIGKKDRDGDRIFEATVIRGGSSVTVTPISYSEAWALMAGISLGATKKSGLEVFDVTSTQD